MLDEINSYLDMPSEEIYDVFEDTIFQGHPLGRNILGTSDLVKGFGRAHWPSSPHTTEQGVRFLD